MPGRKHVYTHTHTLHGWEMYKNHMHMSLERRVAGKLWFIHTMEYYEIV